MLRPVMAVALASALLAASQPAIDAGARTHSDAWIAGEVTELTTAMRDLAARESGVEPGTGGARRVVTIRVPERSRTADEVDYVAVGGQSTRTGGGSAIRWSIGDGPVRNRRVPGIGVAHAPNGRIIAKPLVITDPGVHRLALTLVERKGERVIAVRRLPET